MVKNLSIATTILMAASVTAAPAPIKTHTEHWHTSIAVQTGRASFYGHECEGHTMANGQPFNPRALTAASYTLPLGSRVRITNVRNGASIIVIVTDRGPAKRLHRIIDLSEAAASELRYTHEGLTVVVIEKM